MRLVREKIEVADRIIRIDKIEFEQMGKVEFTAKYPDKNFIVAIDLATFYVANEDR